MSYRLNTYQWSISTSLILPIILMGLLAMILVIVTTEIYRNNILNDQKTAISELVHVSATELMQENLDLTKELTFGLLSPKIKKIFSSNDLTALGHYLDANFNRYFVNSGAIKLDKYYAYDKDFNLLTKSNRGITLNNNEIICPELRKSASQRKGASRLASISELCIHEQRPYLSVITAIGGLRPVGYIQTITDPVPALKNVEKKLGFPLHIHLLDDDSNAVYESTNWPDNKHETKDYLLANTTIKTAKGDIAYTIETSRDMRDYFANLREKRNYVIAVAAILTLIMSFAAHMFIRFSTIKPLQALMQHAHAVSGENISLDEKINLQGVREIRDLSDSFNGMTSGLSQLYKDLSASNNSLTDEINERKSIAVKLHEAHDELTEKVVALNEISDDLKQSNEQLINEVQQRILTERQLIIAKEGAESASKAKSKFLTSMSHELRTPLNAIMGFSQLLGIKENIDAATKNMADKIYRSGEHLLNLITEVLDLAKIESGKVELKMEHIALHDLLDECLEILTPLANKTGVHIELSACNCPSSISADRTRLKQVILNLMSNAIKYNQKDGNVLISCAENSEGELYIVIRDTGTGIEPSLLNKLFEPFNRLGKETGGIEGTGIGLVVTKELVEMMGFTLGVESVVGKGSTFRIEIPPNLYGTSQGLSSPLA